MTVRLDPLLFAFLPLNWHSYGRIDAFLVGLLFSFVNYHLDEAVVMLSFPPSIFGSRILALFAATFEILLAWWVIDIFGATGSARKILC